MPKTTKKSRLRRSAVAHTRKRRSEKELKSEKKLTAEEEASSDAQDLERRQQEVPQGDMASRAITAQELVRRLRHIFTTAAAAHEADCAVNAPAMEKYLRNKFRFIGFKAPLRRELQKQFETTNGGHLRERRVLMDFLLLLWEQEEREMQGVGCDLASKLRATLLGESEEEFTEAVACVRELIVRKSWWDTVDSLAYPGEFLTTSQTLY